MSQSQVTEYFHGRKRNSNFQPSKRQKVEVVSSSANTSRNGTLQISQTLGSATTSRRVVQTKSATKITQSRKNNTRSRIPKLRKDKSRNVQLTEIWPKTCDKTFSSDLVSDADGISQELPQKLHSRPSTTSKQHKNVTENSKNKDEGVPVTIVHATDTVNGDKISISPSKRHFQSNVAEENETSTVSDVATAVIDDHGNSYPCTPSKRLNMVSGSVSGTGTNKRGRCLVPTDSSNYYKTPQKFDFSPYQSSTSTQRSSSARKKLVLSNIDVTKAPPVFTFKGNDQKSPELSAAVEVKEKVRDEIRKKAKDAVIESSSNSEHGANDNLVADEVEPADETLTSKAGSKEVLTPRISVSNIVKIGTCKNLEQLKKKLQDLSPRKAKASGSGVDSSPATDRYTVIILDDLQH